MFDWIKKSLVSVRKPRKQMKLPRKVGEGKYLSKVTVAYKVEQDGKQTGGTRTAFYYDAYYKEPPTKAQKKKLMKRAERSAQRRMTQYGKKTKGLKFKYQRVSIESTRKVKKGRSVKRVRYRAVRHYQKFSKWVVGGAKKWIQLKR